MKNYWYKSIKIGKHKELSIWIQIEREWFILPTVRYYCHSLQFLWLNCKMTFFCKKIYTEEEFAKIIKQTSPILVVRSEDEII